MSRQHFPRPSLCLWCSTPLTAEGDGAIRCARCGRGNRREDLAKYRTLASGARRLQTTLEVLAAITLGACTFAAMIFWRHLKGGDPRVHWSLLGAVGAACMVGYFSRFITQRWTFRLRRPSFLGCAGVLLAFGTYFTVLALTQSDLEGRTLEVALVLAGIVVGMMGLRVWRATRRAT